jgi:hypothetical protein
LIALATPAIAQEKPPPGTRAETESRLASVLQQARKARDAGRWADAAAAYSAALATPAPEAVPGAPRAELLGELGLCELQLGKHRDAAEHLALGLAGRAFLPLPLQHRFEEGRRKAEAHVGTLYLGVNPTDAEVFVDGRSLGAPAPTHEVFLEAGRHTIRARLTGHADATVTLDVSAGKVQTLALELPRASEEPLARSAPAPSAPAPPAPSSLPGTLRTASLVATGATAALGGTLVAWGFATDAGLDDRSAELQRQGWTRGSCVGRSAEPACQDLRDTHARGALLVSLGWVSLATSGALGVVTLASFLIGSEPKNGQGMRAVALATGQSATVGIGGTW